MILRVFFLFFFTYWGTAFLCDKPPKIDQTVLRNQVVYSIFPASIFLVYTPGKEKTSYLTVIWQIIACVLLTDVFFYPMHRLLHTKYLYRHFHKRHHDIRECSGAAALHTGPIEYILTILAPLLGPALLGCTEEVLLIWTFLSTFNLVLAHAFEGRHRKHHRSKGNFGVGLMLMDRVCGTLQD